MDPDLGDRVVTFEEMCAGHEGLTPYQLHEYWETLRVPEICVGEKGYFIDRRDGELVDPRWDVESFDCFCSAAALAWVDVGFLRDLKREERDPFSLADYPKPMLIRGPPPKGRNLYVVSACRGQTHIEYPDSKDFFLNALIRELDRDKACDDDLVYWEHMCAPQGNLSSPEVLLLQKYRHMLYVHFRLKHIVLPDTPDGGEHVPYFADALSSFEFSVAVFTQRVVNSDHPTIKSHMTPEWFLSIEQKLSTMGAEEAMTLIAKRRALGRRMARAQHDAHGFQTACREAEFRWVKVWFIHFLAKRGGPAPRCQDLPPNTFVVGVVPPGCQPFMLSYPWSAHLHFAPAGGKMWELSQALKRLGAADQDHQVSEQSMARNPELSIATARSDPVAGGSCMIGWKWD